MKEELIIGIDLGATNIKAVLTNQAGKVIHELSTPTQDEQGKDKSTLWKASLKSLIEQLEQKANSSISAIGISSSGTVHTGNKAVLSNGTKMLGIEGLVWEDYLGKEVFVLNDAHAALFAESKIGAGKAYEDIVLLTLGTGIGGGIMIDGKILQGQMGRAGHIGHISVNQQIQSSIVKTPGSLELSFGECHLEERSHGRFTNTKELLEAHNQGNGFASWLWYDQLQSLARAIVSLINLLSPEVIIVGGGVAKAQDEIMKPLRDFLDVYEWRPGNFETPIKFAELSSHAGAIGAALFALEKKKKS